MSRVKRWLFERFLPAYQQESYVEEAERLRNKIALLESELKAERAYSRGLEIGLKARRIVINNEVK